MTFSDPLAKSLNKPSNQPKTIVYHWHNVSSRTWLMFMLFVMILSSSYFIYNQNIQEQQQSVAIIAKPHVNDIYFLDFRLLSNKLRPHEKYRIAKVVDITGDIVTLLYGDFYYPSQNAARNAIRYGQLRFRDYFEPKRYNLSISTINAMASEGSIYLAKRPLHDRLYGNFVSYEQKTYHSTRYTPGKRENISAQSFLHNLVSQPYNERYQQNSLQSAYDLLKRSASYGYAQGQTNFAQMYIKGLHVQKDLTQALYWLKQASLQSHKPAIYKYAIVCEQVASCQLYDFYKDLTMAGVNIKVRNLDFSLTSNL